jgi:hypothetical protein
MLIGKASPAVELMARNVVGRQISRVTSKRARTPGVENSHISTYVTPMVEVPETRAQKSSL